MTKQEERERRKLEKEFCKGISNEMLKRFNGKILVPLEEVGKMFKMYDTINERSQYV